MRVRVCPKCKKHNSETAWYCTNCGETLSIKTIIETDNDQLRSDHSIAGQPTLSEKSIDSDSFPKDKIRAVSDHSSSYEQSKVVNVERASFWRRWLAFTIDGAILGLVDGCISGLSGNEETPAGLAIALGIISFMISVLYFIGPYSTGGKTLGKKLLDIKVVSIDGSPLNWRKGILRYVGYILGSIPLGLGFLWSIWDTDEQAWHDKIAGTCVVRSWVTREQLQGTIDPVEARRRQKKWSIGLGIPFILIVASGSFWLFSFYQSSMAEVRDMGPWPSPEVSPREAIMVDLTHLDLNVGQIVDARKVEEWADGQYNDGIAVTYEVGKNTVVSIVGVRYDNIDSTSNDFENLMASAEDVCPIFTSAYLRQSGVIQCSGNDYAQKLFMSDYWIVSIFTRSGTEYTPEVLLDKVRDAIAIHWEGISHP